MPKIKKSGFHANKTKLGFQKTWLLCHKIWLSRQTNKNRLPYHKTKFGSHATKSLAPMPQNQNLAFMPQKSALMPKTGFHAKQNLAFTPQKWLPCQKLAFMPSKTWLSCHKNQLSCQKPGFLPQNLAFMPKNNHLTKDFHKMTTF